MKNGVTCMSLKWWLTRVVVWSSNHFSRMSTARCVSSSSLCVSTMSHKCSRKSFAPITTLKFTFFSHFYVQSFFFFFFNLHPGDDLTLLWSPRFSSDHQVCCCSPSATERLTPASGPDALGIAWTPLWRSATWFEMNGIQWGKKNHHYFSSICSLGIIKNLFWIIQWFYSKIYLW